MSVLSLQTLCEDAVLRLLESGQYHPRLINIICRRVPAILLERVFHSLVSRAVLTDVALLAFLLPDRTELSLCNHNHIKNNTFKQISLNCPNLLSLDLSDCLQVSNSVIRQVLQLCPSLSSLRLDRCRLLSDAAFCASQSPFLALRGLHSLRALSLKGLPQLSGALCRSLAKQSPHLAHLVLAQCAALCPAQLAPLAALDLAHLDLAFSSAADELFAACTTTSFSTSLHTLLLTRCPVTDASLLALANTSSNTTSSTSSLAALRNLSLGWSGVGDLSLPILSLAAPLLRTLDLRALNISDASLRALAACANLTHLDLSWCANFSDAGLLALAHCPSTASFSTSFSTSFSASGEDSWYAASGYSGFSVNSSDQTGFPGYSGYSESDDRVAESQIESLSLVWCSQLTDACLPALFHMKKLKRVDLSGCTGITDNFAIYSLRERGVEVIESL